MKLVTLAILLICCTSTLPKQEETKKVTDKSVHHSSGNSIMTRFACPDSFARMRYDSGSFAWYLERLALKPEGEQVKYYNGDTKDGEYVYCAVVDMPITGKDLQQCADAVMRLRGEYLYSMKRYGDISFRFTGDGKMHGFKEYAKGDYSYRNFRKYMDYVFGYANTSSLKKQLRSIPFSQMQIGDVLVQSGNPYGHAVIVVDMCMNAKGEKQYMLAQSYMPAQETQVLVKPGTAQPWYSHPGGNVIATPEWTFDTADLRRW